MIDESYNQLTREKNARAIMLAVLYADIKSQWPKDKAAEFAFEQEDAFRAECYKQRGEEAKP